MVERYLTLGKLAKAKLGWQPVPKPRSQVLMAKAPTPSPVVGFNCGEHGHIRRECPKQSEPMDCSVGRTTRPLVSLAAGNGSPTETSLFRMLVQLEGQEVWALVDTGSNLTMISANLVPPRADQVLPPVKELCIHGDVEECPCVHLPVIKKSPAIKGGCCSDLQTTLSIDSGSGLSVAAGGDYVAWWQQASHC